ncbi:hypothetical protein LQ938_11895 [Microbacterium sp. cx-55]|uniref:hypothetical protein n=1 Tax=Microbacterium sp. cx-55 TaxID=2875948 RepID=UPI001CBCF6ED|nr:hypothetical protein [Microbacterium sp. cx-55]MBZ4488027.1 hypothetical protein [Microbacterium sp. cx-55]UGB34567.1 hypothetical protein LQ938_11895 [Microbacterium sp. cx-55]
MTTNREAHLRRRLEQIEAEIERRMTPSQKQAAMATRTSLDYDGDLTATERQIRQVLDD